MTPRDTPEVSRARTGMDLQLNTQVVHHTQAGTSQQLRPGGLGEEGASVARGLKRGTHTTDWVSGGFCPT